ncbi:MAG: hypothetical protein ACKVUS_09785 [Saprospiraceae bacterium]
MSKKLFLLPLLLLGAFLFTTTTSCGDKCKDADCVNGVCLDNSCECDAGYEYDSKGNCTVEVRAKLIGIFEVTEHDAACTSDPDPYLVAITAGTAADEISISNFYAAGTITATVSNDSRVTIPTQNLGADFTVSGSGTIDQVGGKTQLTMEYTIKDKATGVDVANCTNVAWVAQ